MLAVKLLDKLDETYTFDLPQRLLDSEFEVVWKQVEEDMQRNEKYKTHLLGSLATCFVPSVDTTSVRGGAFVRGAYRGACRMQGSECVP